MMQEIKIYIPNHEVTNYLDAALAGNTTDVCVMLNRRWYMIDVPSEDNETALMLAAWNGNVETAEMLCQHNASTFVTNDDDENVFDQVPNIDKNMKKDMDKILQRARNDEIESWNLEDRDHNRVKYEKDPIDGGVWCYYEIAGNIRLSSNEMNVSDIMCT
jgi:ankyrin repeat protein